MNNVFLLLGGNLGDRYKLIEMAKKSIHKKIGSIEKESSVYETAPWGFSAEQNFLNQVVQVKTELSAKDVLKLCLEIENALGRKRNSSQYESRTMDIDILFFNDDIIKEDNLIIPHPKLYERRFTLEPMVEIAPKFIHPMFKKEITILLEECKDISKVVRLNR